MTNIFEKAIDKLTPTEVFPALQITDKKIKYALFSSYDFSIKNFSEIELPQGTIVKGEVKNIANLTSALNNLKNSLNSKNKKDYKIQCLVSLQSSVFFLRTLEIPDVSDISYEEAVKLNLPQISPIEVKDAYYDFQNLGVNQKTKQREFLIGIASKNKLNDYLEAFKRTNFQPLAIEPESLSILRDFQYFSRTVEKNATNLIVYFSADGLMLLITKEGKLLFDYYLYWNDIEEAQDGQITSSDLQSLLTREIRRVLEFYYLRSGENIAYFSFISPFLKEELAQFISTKLNLKEIKIVFPEFNYPVLQNKTKDDYAGLIGIGVRSTLISRSNDNYLSVTSQDTTEIYKNFQLNSFISLWGKIIAFTLLGLTCILAGVYGVLSYDKNQAEESLSNISNASQVVQFQNLQENAKEFNFLLDQLEKISQSAKSSSEYLAPIIENASSNGIVIKRFNFASGNKNIIIQASASSQSAALNYKSQLEASGVFEKVDLPLSSFSQNPQGVDFNLIATIL
jgi:Tfp pilus assembly PilM family ATPase